MERVLEPLSKKWNVPIKFLSSEIRELCGREGRKNVKAEGKEDPRRSRPSESTEEISYELRDWSNKHRAYISQQQILCEYIIPFSLTFLWDYRVYEQMGL